MSIQNFIVCLPFLTLAPSNLRLNNPGRRPSTTALQTIAVHRAQMIATAARDNARTWPRCGNVNRTNIAAILAIRPPAEHYNIAVPCMFRSRIFGSAVSALARRDGHAVPDSRGGA